MVSIPWSWREPSLSRRAHIALHVAIAGVGASGCSDLLDIPDDPYLVDSSVTAVTENVNPGVVSPGPGSSEPDEPSAELIERQLGHEQTPASELASSSEAHDSADAGAGDAGVVAAASPCGLGESTGPNGHCYATVATLLPWADARTSCRSRGAGWDLAAIHDAVTNDFLAVLVPGETWIGASDATSEGSWIWVIDDVPFWIGTGAAGNAPNGAFDNWNSDEPNGGGASDCARLVAGIGTWADLECAMLRASVCEGPAL